MRPRALYLTVGLILFAQTALQAQIPGINLGLFPRIGVYQPTSALTEVNGNRIELQSGLAIGLAAELSLPLLPLNFRANLDYATGTGTKTNDIENGSGDNTVLVLTGDLVLRLLPGVSPVQAYLLGGAGIKQYDFDVNSFSVNFPEKESDFTGHLGAGLGFKVGPLALMAELSDYISSFKLGASGDSKLQNDVFAMVGFRIGMF